MSEPLTTESIDLQQQTTAKENGGLSAEQEAAPQRNDERPAEQALRAYDSIKLPENAALDDHTFSAFKTLAKELNLSPEAAQKLVDFEADFGGKERQKNDDERQQILQGWADKTKEMFGTRSEQEIACALQAVDAFGGPDLRELFELTGLGNHPVIVKTFNEIGKQISEDVSVNGKPAGGRDKTFAEALYGK